MKTDELDFELPQELIAQEPAAERAASRLLHYNRADRSVSHRTFAELPGLLRAGDVLVFNDSKVVPAKFTLQKATGGRVEGLFLEELRPGRWRVLLKNLGRTPVPLHFADAPEVTVTVAAPGQGGEHEVEVSSRDPAHAVLARLGRMPLPPYIKRAKDHDARDESDRQRYQTVYAHEPGSVAAPTAGLHFTPELLERIRALGVEERFVTLHVGMGTFKPVTADTLEAHDMHAETYTITAETADALNRAKREGRRIISVGTTATRVLESQPAEEFVPRTDSTRIFIYPPYAWKHVGAMITNFHLPRSTLVALVASLTGLDEQRRIYRTAIDNRYRFFSYGDAMFVD
jgi:S-adenosylmethionine:tRNA ribosyltransferase-isomerase